MEKFDIIRLRKVFFSHFIHEQALLKNSKINIEDIRFILLGSLTPHQNIAIAIAIEEPVYFKRIIPMLVF